MYYNYTIRVLVTLCFSILLHGELVNKKEQPPQAVLSYTILLLVIAILTAMTNAVES